MVNILSDLVSQPLKGMMIPAQLCRDVVENQKEYERRQGHQGKRPEGAGREAREFQFSDESFPTGPSVLK